jgi:PAS domain S-box-containing protein
MTHRLDDVLKRLVNDSRADAALVWCRSGPNGVAVGLGGYPMTIAPTALLCLASTGVADDAVERTSSATVPVPGPGSGTVPGPGSDALMQALPAAPAADRSFVLGEDLVLTVVWCDQAVASGIPDRWQPDLLEQVAAVASVCRDLYCANGEVERLRAAVNGLQDGVVTLNPGVGLAAVNRAAATLLGLPQGKNPVAALDSALDRLAGRALNCSEINDCRSLLESDPEASIACMWRFPTEPTHLWVVSKPVDNQNFHGRTWVFYDESESSRALGSSERAHAQLRASADAMLDPQALLEAIRDESGLVVDFVYRDVNRATCAYLSMTRDELVGHAVLETMPNLKTSGMLARYAHCVETGDPLILDDIRYDNEVLSGPRHYDIRGAHAGAGFIILTWRDVTERVQSAQRIAESEEHYRLVADNVGDVVMHIRRGAVAWVSPSVEEALGAAPDHWIGRPLMEIIPEEDHQAADKVVWLADDRAVIPCGRLKAADGQTHWVHVHAKSFYDADGNPDGYTASFRVIDDEVRAVEQVELADQRQAEADARYRRLMDSSAVPMCVTTPEGRFEVVNDAMCRYFGYDAEVLRTKTWPELAAPEYLDSDVAEFARIIAGESETHRGVKEYLHADGHRIWGDLSVSCLRKPNGEVESIIAQIIDITERVRTQRVAEDARRMEAAARARYRNLMDNAAVGMGVIEPDGRLEEVNQAACDFFGYDAATLKQMTWQQLTAPEYLEADFINVENMMAGRIESFRLRFAQTAHGQVAPNEMTVWHG